MAIYRDFVSNPVNLTKPNDEKTVGFEGLYEDILPGKKLVFPWAHVIAHANGEREVTPVSRVEVNFIPNGKGTDVRLVHTALSTEDARHGVGGGWEASFSELSTLFDEPSPPMKTATGGTSGRNRS